jgi:hypothetical protein
MEKEINVLIAGCFLSTLNQTLLNNLGENMDIEDF